VTYSFPQSHEDLEHIKWDKVYADDSKTYPKGELPTKDEYAQVKRVYEFVIEEKDKQAQALGKPKSGALRYGTVRQRWQQWRDYCAVARITNPTMSAQSCLDLLTVWLKNCSSKDQIDNKLKEAIGKYKNKLYRERRKHLEIEKDQLAAKEAVKKAEAAAKEADEALKTVTQEVEEIEALPTAHRTHQSNAATKKKKEEIDAAQKAKDEAEAQKRQKERQLQELDQKKRAVENESPNIADTAKSKKLKRNDTKKLTYDTTPWKKHEASGEKWKPPMRKGKYIVYDEPGDHWKAESLRKLNLLYALEQHLEAEHALEQPLTMSLVMEFLGFDADGGTMMILILRNVFGFSLLLSS
jgi:DNA repair exonuclease SbcCD ATPase subunit